jgi:hypothetical protein
MRADWELGAGAGPGPAVGRVVKPRTSFFGRTRYAAEWPDPNRPRVVIRHWFSTRQEARDALRGSGPFADQQRPVATKEPSWLLKRELEQ